MVRIAPQYNDLLTWQSERTQNGVDEWGTPIYTDGVENEVIGRYENFQGKKKEFLGQDGVTILENDGVFYCSAGLDYPKRFDLINVRDTKFQVLHVYKGFYNTTIYLKEVKA